MGTEIALELNQLGAHVTVVSGPLHKALDHPKIQVKNVISASEMLYECERLFPQADIIVFAAATSDYRPTNPTDYKIKKNTQSLTITLTQTTDIAKKLGKEKKKNQFTMGFALETENAKENAKEKLKEKNFDLIAVNSPLEQGAGFGYNTNKISLIDNQGRVKDFALKSKKEVAKDIVEAILNQL